MNEGGQKRRMARRKKGSAGTRNTPRTGSTVSALASESPVVREQERNRLVSMGKAAVPFLVEALSSRDRIVRWEAAKAFSVLHDAAAAPALVQALEDEVMGIRWLAGEALIALDREGLAPLFGALIHRSESVRLRQGAHHVLRALAEGRYAPLVDPVLKALESPAPIVALPVAAFNAMKQL